MTKKTEQPNLTKKQREILLLLYKFRFLNRKQIQDMLNHKDHRRVQSWLNELTNQKLIVRYYNIKFASSPSVYVLDKAGRNYLKGAKEVKSKALQSLWREKQLSLPFQNQCQFIADIYLSLLKATTKSKLKLFFNTRPELAGMAHLVKPTPDAYIAIDDKKGKIKRYFLEIFGDIAPLALRKRVKQYLEYYNSDEWQDNTDKPFPEIILICPNNRLKNHLFYFIKSKLHSQDEPSFYLSTWDTIKLNGITKGALEKVASDD